MKHNHILNLTTILLICTIKRTSMLSLWVNLKINYSRSCWNKFFTAKINAHPKKVFLSSSITLKNQTLDFFSPFSWMNINQIPKQHVDYLWQLQFTSQSAQNATNITQLGSYVQKILFWVSILVQICIFYCQYMMKQLFLWNDLVHCSLMQLSYRD